MLNQPANQLDSIQAGFSAASISTIRQVEADKYYYTSGMLERLANWIHRDQLPPAPKNWRDLQHHPLKSEFIKAAKAEWSAITKQGTYKVVEQPKNKSSHPIMLGLHIQI